MKTFTQFVESQFNQCYAKACQIAKAIGGEVWNVSDFKGDVSTADEKWKSLPANVWNHYVAVKNDLVYDPTASQFGSKEVEYPLSELYTKWQKIYKNVHNELM